MVALMIKFLWAQILAETCYDAGKHPNCCNRVNASACYVPGGNCYCDPLCTLYHDCCADAETHLSRCSPGELTIN